MPYNYPNISLNKPYTGISGEMLSGGSTGFMPSLIGGATRVGLGVATGGTSEIVAQILNLIPSIFQGIMGGSQLRKAKKFEEQYPRPEAEIAPSVNQLVNYNYGRTLANDIPGGEMYRGEIKGATAAGIKAASEMGSGSEAYGMLGQITGKEQDSFGNLAKLTAQQVAGYQGEYANSLLAKGQEENRVWDWNKAQPYLQAAQIAAQLRDSGLKNLYSGGANAFGAAAEATSPDFNSSLLWGQGNKGTAGQPSMEDVMKWINSLKE